MKIHKFKKEKLIIFYLIPTIIYKKRNNKKGFSIGVILFNYCYLYGFE